MPFDLIDERRDPLGVRACHGLMCASHFGGSRPDGRGADAGEHPERRRAPLPPQQVGRHGGKGSPDLRPGPLPGAVVKNLLDAGTEIGTRQ